MTKQRIVTILGMSRSGTSFLGSWLHKCGLDMGEKTLAADAYFNTKGYFEDEEFLSHYFEIQKKSNRNIKQRLLSAPVKYTIEEKDKYRAKELIQKRVQRKQQWGWKLPPAALMWNELWQPVINDLNIKKGTIIIGAFRHFEKSVLSNMKVVASEKEKKNIMYKWHLVLFKHRTANNLLVEWIESNKTLIRLIEGKEYEMIFLLDTNTLLRNSKNIFQVLREDFKLDLNYIDPLDLYDEKLMDREVDIKYRLDKKLVKEATEVYEKLIELRDTQSFMHRGSFNNVVNSIPQ